MVLVSWIVVVHLPRLSCVCRGPVDVLVSWTRGRSGLVGTLTLSDLTPHRQEPEGQSAVRPAHSVFIGPQAAFVVPYDPVHFVGYSVGNMTGNAL